MFVPILVVALLAYGATATVNDTLGPYATERACQERLGQMITVVRALPVEATILAARCQRRP
jgi:hypothetical protein